MNARMESERSAAGQTVRAAAQRNDLERQGRRRLASCISLSRQIPPLPVLYGALCLLVLALLLSLDSAANGASAGGAVAPSAVSGPPAPPPTPPTPPLPPPSPPPPAAQPSASAPVPPMADTAGLAWIAQELLRMRAEGVETPVLKAYVQGFTTPYEVTSREVIALHRAGVEADVTTTLLRRGAELRTQAAQASQRPTLATAPPTPPAPAITYVYTPPPPSFAPVSYPAPSSWYRYWYGAAYPSWGYVSFPYRRHFYSPRPVIYSPPVRSYLQPVVYGGFGVRNWPAQGRGIHLGASYPHFPRGGGRWR